MQVVLILALLLYATAVQAQLRELRVAVFISGIDINAQNSEFTGLGSVDGRQFRAATELAVEAVNNHPDILSDYTLQAFYVDSKCSAGPSVRGFIDQIFNTSERVMIIGADCSTATEPIAELAPSWGLVQISPLSTSPAFSNNATFNNFLRLVPSDTAAALGVVTLMERFDWSRLGVISQQETGFITTLEELSVLLAARNFTSVTSTFNTRDNPTPFLEGLANSPIRIIFLNVYPAYAVEILCLAYEQGMTSAAGYQWLLYPWYPQQWWYNSNTSNPNSPYLPVTCPRANIEAVLDRAILINYLPVTTGNQGNNDVTAAGITRVQYETLLRERLADSYPGADTSLFSQTHLYFDSLLLAALALNKTAETYDLSQFSYNMSDTLAVNLTRDLYSNALSTSLYGVSGQITGGRERQPVIRFHQYRQRTADGLDTELIGNLTSFESNDSIFPRGVPIDEEMRFISLPLFIVYTILSCVGVVFAVGVAIFLMVFRQRTVIKFSSPYLNLLIISGGILFFLNVILFGIDEGTPAATCTVNALCMARIWIAVIAFDLLYGTIFLKTWRAYYAVLSRNRGNKDKDKKIRMKIVPDWALLVVLVILIAVDLLLLVIVTALPETRLQLVTEIVESTTSARPTLVRACSATHAFLWLSLVGIAKVVPLLIGLFLAYELRNAKIKMLNDSKLIGMSVYGIAIMSIGAAIVGTLLSITEFVDVLYSVVGILIMMTNLLVLLLLFIPKLYKLHKDPEGLRVVVSPDPHVLSSGTETIAGLADEVQKLKQELDQLSGDQVAMATPVGMDDSVKLRADDDSVVLERKSVHFSSRD